MGKIRKIIQDNNHFLIIFIPPSPVSPVGDTCLFTIFVYTFGKGEEGRGRYSGGLDTPFFHTTYYVLFIPHTIWRFPFGDDHLWQLTFPMLIFIPPIDDFLVDDLRWFPFWWWSSLTMLVCVVYTFNLIILTISFDEVRC